MSCTLATLHVCVCAGLPYQVIQSKGLKQAGCVENDARLHCKLHNTNGADLAIDKECLSWSELW